MSSAQQLLRAQRDLLLKWTCDHPAPLLRWLHDEEVLSPSFYFSLLEKPPSDAVAKALDTVCTSEESSQRFLEVLKEVQDYYCKDLHLWVDRHCGFDANRQPPSGDVKDEDEHKKPKGAFAKLFKRKNKGFSIRVEIKGKKDPKLRSQMMANLKVLISAHKTTLLKRMEELKCYSEGSREASNSASHIEIRYTDLFVTEDNDFTDSSQHEYFDLASRRARIYVHQSCQRIRPSQLLSPQETTGQPPKRVKVKGIAGIGKSVAVQRLVYEWAIGKSMREFTCIFDLCFRELNLIETPLSLLDLLGERFRYLKDALPNLFTEPKYLLFILDGLDEFKFFLDWNSRDKNIGIESKVTVSELIVALVKGNLLPEASIILTTRPSTEAPKHFFQRCCVVLGFEENQVKEYTTKFYKDREVAEKVYDYISNNDNIFVLSFIPLYCYIICMAMGEFFSSDTQDVGDFKSLELNPPRTVSEVYLCYLFTTVKHHALRGSAERSTQRSEVLSLAKQQLTNLGKLAYENLLQRKIMFSKEDLERYGVTPAEIQGTFLCQILHPLKEEAVDMFSFFHLTVQEHLGALYCALNLYSQEDITQALNLWCFGLHPPSTTSTLLRNIDPNVDMLDSLQMFTRFFMGLLRARLESQLDGLVDPSMEEENGVPAGLGLWFKDQFKDRKMKNETALNLLHCLMEFHMKETTTIAAPEIKKLNLFKMKLSIVDCAAMYYVLKFSPHTLQELNLGYSNIGNRGLHRLRPILHRCESLYLRYNCLDWQAAILESAILKSKECQVKKLFMCGNNLGPEGVNELWRALEQNSTVEELYLDITGVTEKGTENIVNCLGKNASLRILTIVGNEIGEVGRERLRELQKLRPDLRIIANFVDDLGLLQAYLGWVDEIRADRDQMDSVKNVDALQSVLNGLQGVAGKVEKGENAGKAMELRTKIEELLKSHMIGGR
ncbi:NLR family CARD domain-containing protein 3 [Fundulus heteroclitus]|uniref:NLR family CARD domain-containing protein 3 n=1 Tax=Fundulus heteroclitus TaxID=8078 RepID=UPI00165AD551|nr:NLR family CARD domain-containing protein 3 [Fundulus heteroclitus]